MNSIAWFFLCLAFNVCLAGAGEVLFTIVDGAGGEPMPARIHLRDRGGKPVKPAGFPSWHDHFVCDGKAIVPLPEGNYSYTVERGPEYEQANGQIEIPSEMKVKITVPLRRFANLAAEGWFGGETHVHRPLHEIELLMRAEDLHVAQVITWWNKANIWKEKAPDSAIRGFDGNRYYQLVSGEDERDGGALLFCDLASPLEITAGAKHYPSSLKFATEARARGAKWIDAEKPFWWDFPMWIAHGAVDTTGIAHNHMHRAGVLENEAWGRARDRDIYPGPLGNALWTQHIYYHALNCGVRLPPSAGSASGVLPNPVGYNRVYVLVDGELTYEKWRDGLLQGRTFVSNGPLLRCRANGKPPGQVFQSDKPITVEIEGRLDSRDPLKTVEIVHNGKAEQVMLPARFLIEKSGWFLVRAIADVPHTFRFAATAPWYVEIAGQPMEIPPESARFFVDWCRERIATLEKRTELDSAQRKAVLDPWQEALKYWEALLKTNK